VVFPGVKVREFGNTEWKMQVGLAHWQEGGHALVSRPPTRRFRKKFGQTMPQRLPGFVSARHEVIPAPLRESAVPDRNPVEDSVVSEDPDVKNPVADSDTEPVATGRRSIGLRKHAMREIVQGKVRVFPVCGFDPGSFQHPGHSRAVAKSG